MRLEDRQRDEFRRALKSDHPPVEPTEEEKRNGWTTETLTAYVAEQEAAGLLRADPMSAFRAKRPMKANSRYNPFRWRP